MIPYAYSGEVGNRVLALNEGHQDVDQGIAFLVESGAVAPAGLDGDCGFEGVRIPFTWQVAADLEITVTPLLDGVAQDEAAQVVTLAASADRTSDTFELIFRLETAAGYRYQLRGTWFALRIEGVKGDGEILFDPAALLYEVLTDSHSHGTEVA